MKISFVLIFVIVLSGCASNQAEVSTPEPLNQNPIDQNNLNQKVISTWEGVIPCGDCPGIVYTLNLKNDSSYTSKMVYKEKSVDALMANGTWNMNDSGKIVLRSSEAGSSQQYLMFNGDFVEMLDGDGNKMPSGMDSKLYKKDSTVNTNGVDTTPAR